MGGQGYRRSGTGVGRIGLAVALLLLIAAPLAGSAYAGYQPRPLAAGDEPMGRLAAGGPAFRVRPFGLVAVPLLERPYETTRQIPLVDSSPHDASGVRMAVVEGRMVDHPVAQAHRGFELLAAYHRGAGSAYLDAARRQADRLLGRAVTVDGAIYARYEFDFPRHGNSADVMRAPWVSAMAQGQLLSLLVRLHDATGEDAYLTDAHAVFASFRRIGPREGPWTAFVDAAGYYWPEEYPAAVPDRTFNGMIFAAYGLYDYYLATADPDALLLWQATLTTALEALQQGIRAPGELSRYCLEHGVQNPNYHRVHVGQLHLLARLTGDGTFERWAKLLESDGATAPEP